MALRVAINGLGRIGRCVIRAASELKRHDIEIVAVNGPAAREDHRHLLKYDSVHGVFPGDVSLVGDDKMQVGGLPPFLVTHEREPEKLPWKELNIDVVLECTGRFCTKESASRHLAAGAKKVIVSAPCAEADATVVYGVNQHVLEPSHDVISVGSCTTNCLAPVAKVLHEGVGIEHGFMTTIHSYTNDQNVLDGSHKNKRRARACAVSMVPTTTGAAKALGLVLPELQGRLGGSAVRVPTPNVSLVDLSFTAQRDTSKEEVQTLLKNAAQGELKNVLDATDEPLVSIDFNHNPHSSIVDLSETYVTGDRFVRVISWYDNEWGFSVRMLDVAALYNQ